jgi:YD repeat-containing protein
MNGSTGTTSADFDSSGDAEAAVRTLRVFISSPRDVGSERALAARTLDRLRFEFRGVCDIQPVFWEQMPMRATDTFQAQIPLAGDTDICVFILWSWFGTPLPDMFRRRDGSPYASGTEFEFESALTSHQARGSPDILVYRKTAELRGAILNREQVMERLAQRDAVQSFIERYFRGEGGTFKAAFREFASPAEFEEMLETHLRELIRAHLARHSGVAGTTPLWTQSPFRGLEVFDAEHALIFCGRTRAVTEAIDILRRRAEAARPMLLVIGNSGSGKSSLVRAGLVPMLTQPRVIEEVNAWRRAVLRPGDPDGPVASLAGALLEDGALPELALAGIDAASLAELLRDKPSALAPSLKLTLARVAEHGRLETPALDPSGAARLILVIDQFEELFASAVSTAERSAFAAAVAALAASSQVWVIATMRADFYARCGELPEAFGDLIRGDGTYELRPPGPAEIAQMIRRPAQLAGLSFERNPETEEGLDDVLRDAASANPAALPLLQFALDELYKRRQGDRLRFADYAALGGLEGALRQRAEEEYVRLADPVRAALPAVLAGLVRIDLENDAVAARRVPRLALEATTGAVDLADAFVRARLFVADRGEGEGPTVGVAHEALLREWARAREWIEANKALLRLRARIAAAAMLWRESGQDAARLLPAGRALAEAVPLLAMGSAGLPETITEFIVASRDNAARQRRRRRWFYGAAAGVAAVGVIAGGLYYDGYVATKVRYYANFTKRFGTYEGFPPELSADAVRHRAYSVKLTFAGRYGPAIGIDVVNGHGACPNPSPVETYLGNMNRTTAGAGRLCRAEVDYAGGKIAGETALDRDGKLLWSFIYTNAERTTAEFHARNGSMVSMSQSGASTVRFSRIETGPLRGRERRLDFLDAYGHPQPDSAGRYGREFEFDDIGRITRVTSLGQDGRPTLPRNDAAIIEMRYDAQGNVAGQSFFDERGQPMRHPASGAVSLARTYDQYGNLVSETTLNERGQPIRGNNGFARATSTIDEWGDVTGIAYFDRYGHPVQTTAGYASLKRRYDAEGRNREEDYFAAGGAPVAASNSAERVRGTYDARGNLAELAYFDHDDHPVTLAAGYSRLSRTYDDSGLLIGESYFDAKGEPVDRKNGSAQVRYTVDGTGQPLDEVYLDRLGQRVRITDGYAEVKKTYDMRGNVISTAYFDQDGKPVGSRAGWARLTEQRDDRGNVIEQQYFDASSRPALIDVGYSVMTTTYDQRGDIIQYLYYSSPGIPLDTAKGCPTIDIEYDDYRRQTGWNCRDIAGALMISPRLGYAREARIYDAQGDRGGFAYFDANNQPLRVPSLGFARLSVVYDDDHNIIEASFFDADGKPIVGRAVPCAHVVFSYQEGKRTGHRCLDTPP